MQPTAAILEKERRVDIGGRTIDSKKLKSKAVGFITKSCCFLTRTTWSNQNMKVVIIEHLNDHYLTKVLFTNHFFCLLKILQRITSVNLHCTHQIIHHQVSSHQCSLWVTDPHELLYNNIVRQEILIAKAMNKSSSF